MPTTLSNSPGISQRTTVYAERQMLQHAVPIIVLDKLGLVKPMPANKGVNITFRRPRVFTAATTPLQEGIAPTARAFKYEDVSCSLKQYGDLVEITDVIQDTHEDPVLQDATTQVGENIGRTTESLTWGVVRGGTNVFYTNGTQRTDVNTPVTLSKQRAVTRGLKNQKAMMITSILDGSVNFKTTPVEAAYIAVCHSDVEQDIRGLAGFRPVAEYGNRKPMSDFELGTCESARYIISPDLDPFADGGAAYAGSGTNMVTTSGTSADVYPIMYFGKESYGTVPLRGQGAIEPTILPPSAKDKADPLGQKGFVGFKMWFAALILNQLWLARLEAAVTAL